MPLLHLDALPPKTKRGTVLRLVTQLGGINPHEVGQIEIAGRRATVEVPESWGPRLARLLDGADLAHGHIRAWYEGQGTRPIDDGAHFERLLRWIDVEGRAEARETIERLRRAATDTADTTGLSLAHLTISDVESGLGGRSLVTLRLRDARLPLPWNRLGVGTPVLLVAESARSDQGQRGIVCEREPARIQVALERFPEFDDDDELFRLVAASDEASRERQRAALRRAQTASADRLAQLREIMLGNKPPEFRAEPEIVPFARLNDSQVAAVKHALAARDVAVIHGPPGTGKTTTLIELIRQAILRGDRVLASAPSNQAVDNLVDRLVQAGESVVRLGHPARVTPELRAHTLDLIVDAHPDVRLARKLVREATLLRDKADRYTRAKPKPGAKAEMRREAQQLIADARRLERQVVAEVLDRSSVLCATTTGLDSELLGQRTFDLAVIDEACQSTEPGCWIPLLRADKLVLAGDPCQLPPTVVSTEAAAEGFNVSLQERIGRLWNPGLSRLLAVQYRMHQAIMEFSSKYFYGGALVADASVREHLTADLPGVTSLPLTTAPIDFIDTAGAGYNEELEPGGESRRNLEEASLVVQKIQELVEAGVLPGDIAVITPYAAQVRLLRERLPIAGLEIDTVDGFQGREKEVVVISLVRSNPEGELGFVADERRMNVALTRARRKLIVIGDSATLGAHPFYAGLIEYFERIGAYGTVWDA